MKQFKKLTGILLAIVMMLALSVTAFAANPQKTVKNGETYTAYQIFTKTSNGDAVSYSIDKDSAWVSVIQSYTGTKPALTLSADGSKYLVGTLEETAVDAFAAYLAANIPEGVTGTPVVASDSVVSFTGMAEGYYLITSSLGSTVATTNGSGDITLIEKNTVPDVDKKAETKDAYAAIGDVVNYTITITDGTGTNKDITLHDKMTAGLTLNENSIEVKVNDVAVAADNYTLTKGQNGDTFTIVFDASYVASLNEGDKIVVIYSATVNKDAISVDKSTNTASIDYSNQSNLDTSTVDTKTNSFQVLKYVEGDSTKANLAGAAFQLKQNGTVVKLIKLSDTEYRAAEANEEGAVDSFTTVASGNIVIKGVDSDKTYTLTETAAPAGYNLLTQDVTVTVNADNSTVSEIANNAGSTLPTTGGMGTTLLYAVGIALVLGAGVLLVVRRRMNANR